MSKDRDEAGKTVLHKLLINLLLPPYGQFAQLRGHWAGLLHLIRFAEPFGLSVVEAMACGTPVIAYPRGSMPKLIEHGASGFLVAGETEAVTAVRHLNTLDRAAIRVHAEHFSVGRMVDAYLTAYRSVLAGQQESAASRVLDAPWPK